MAITVNTTPPDWASVFNEIAVEFQREDFQVVGITSGTDVELVSPGSSILDVGDSIYLFGDDGGGNTDSGFFTILERTSNTLFVLASSFSLVATSGYLNSDDVRTNYYLALIAEDEVYLKIVPDATGLLSADISENLVYLLSKENISDYATKYIQDTNIGKSYELEYVEVWGETSQTAVSIGTFNVVFAALDYTDMVPYIIEPSGTPNTFFAKWLTEFEELAYWEGQAFDVAIINAFGSATLFVKEEKHFTDGTTSTDSYALSNWSDVMLRIQLNGGYASNIDYINLYLFDTTRDRLTEKLRINIHQACDDSMSMAWINTLGGLDYWNFTLRQDYSLPVNTKKTIFLKNSEFDLSKSANNNIKLFADDIDVVYQTGLEGLLYCLQAYLYETSSYINVRIDDGESFLFRTDSSKFKIEVKALKKQLNLGHL